MANPVPQQTDQANFEWSVSELEATVTHDQVLGPYWPSEWFNGREDDLRTLYNLVTTWKGQLRNFIWSEDRSYAPQRYYGSNQLAQAKTRKLERYYAPPGNFAFKAELESRHALERFLFAAVWEKAMSEHLRGVPFLAQLIGAYWTGAIELKHAPTEEEKEEEE